MSAGAEQGGFRPGEDLMAGDDFGLSAGSRGVSPATLAFTAASDAGGTDFDILMGYQLFLGRDPESSFVITDAKASPVGAFIRALMASGEFQSAVLDRLASNRPLPHEAASLGPTPEQLDWIFGHVSLPPAHESALRGAATWRDWLRRLVAVPGFPRSPDRVGTLQAASGLAAQPADDGFVLVQVEHPKPGERLQPGTVLAGSGWAIAPVGVADISVHLDEVFLAHARHGLPRPDVARSFPHYRHVDHCGFAFTASIPQSARLTGSSRLVVTVRTIRGETGRKSVWLHDPVHDRAEDPAAQTREAALPVVAGGSEVLTPFETGSAAMRIEVDRPALSGDALQAPARGALTIEGWAIAKPGVSGVSVFCDGVLLGDAHMGMRRADIGAAFPEHDGALLSGYGLVIPAGRLAAGEHRIRVVATARPARPGDAPVTTARSFVLHAEPHAGLLPGAALRTRIPPAEASQALACLADFSPVFDIAIAGRGADNPDLLARTLVSLRHQVYPRWRATVAFSSLEAAARPALRALLASDAAARIAPIWPEQEAAGTARPRKTASARAARGKDKRDVGPRWTLRLRPGDRLAADALLSLAREAGRDRNVDLLYADELRLDLGQGRVEPFLKPDWSPELLLGMNYLGRAWCASASLMARAAVASDSGDYDAVLRLTEQAGAIGHVPRILFDSGARADMPAAEAAALVDCLDRRGVAGHVETGPTPGTWRVRRKLAAPKLARASRAGTARIAGRVSVIMPTCAARSLVRIAVATVRATCAAAAGGGSVEIVVLDNMPTGDIATRTWLRAHADIVVDAPDRFNWSRFNNLGARSATGDVLLFLNDDVEAREPGWLEAMLEQVRRPEIGVVGARLLYPDGTVQHAGQYLARAHARHAFRFAEAAEPGPFGLAHVVREVIAVTGACLMVRTEIFERLGGFDESHDIVNNDLDFCLKSWAAGLSVVATPHATLVHHELASRAALEDRFDAARFGAAWHGRFLRGDPFRNPGLGAESDHYAPDPEPLAELHVGRRGPAIGEVRRILAVKLDHIGDFLTALPALRHLAACFPAALIDLLCPAATAELARREEAVADIVVFDFFHARSGQGRRAMDDSDYAALRARLAPAGYDMAIDLRMQPETREVLPHTGAAFLVGYDHEDRFAFLNVALAWEGDRRLAAKRAHISERLIDLVSAAVDACRAEPLPPLPLALPACGVPVLAALPAAFLARPLVCVHPGVGNVVRQWPPAQYAALIDLLAAEGFHVVLVGGPDEAGIGDAVLREVNTPGAAESLIGCATLAQLSDVVLACMLFVGNNSGPQHLAASLGVPTVGIHSGVVDAAEWAPRGLRALALQRRMACGPCYLEFASDCPRDLACLTGIRPADVLAACLRLLGLPGQSGAGKPKRVVRSTLAGRHAKHAGA